MACKGFYKILALGVSLGKTGRTSEANDGNVAGREEHENSYS